MKFLIILVKLLILYLVIIQSNFLIFFNFRSNWFEEAKKDDELAKLMKNLLSPSNGLFQLMIQNQKNSDIRVKFPTQRLPVSLYRKFN